MDITLPVTLLGVFFLGLFVGAILVLALRRVEFQLKGLAGLLAAVLSGAPVLFMSGLGFEKWMYPVGLTLGLCLLRVLSARDHMVAAARGVSAQRLRQLAIADTAIICAAAAIVVLAILSTSWWN